MSWEQKVKDISVEQWEKWIDFSMVPPQRALVIPFSEDPRDKHWEDRSLRAGVVIDRLRLLELCPSWTATKLKILSTDRHQNGQLGSSPPSRE
jgi:hypothetical protein